MEDIKGYEDIPIGMKLGPMEIDMSEQAVRQRVDLVQWEDRESFEKLGIAQPGLTIVNHARLKFMCLPANKSSIWAKSEHEFIRPFKVGGKVILQGIVTEKYTKRNRKYLVCEYETRDEAGELLMKSRETGVYVE
jgi:hypothetical protein